MNADRRIDGRDVDADTIRKDHLAEVHIGLQAIYLAAVPGIGLVVMLVLLALLDAT
jgi:hypothetical protein